VRLLTWIVILLVMVVLGGGGALWYQRHGTAGGADKQSFRTAQAARGDLLVTITATGTIEPEEAIDVGAQVQGRITEFGKDTNGKSVDNNSEVKQGQVLALIDSSVYQSEVDQAQAALVQAKAGVTRAEADLVQMQSKLRQAERDWNRAKKLGPSDALAEVDYDAYESAWETAKANVAIGQAAIEQAKASVTQSEATLKRAQQSLSYCTIYAPVNGVIITRRVNIGQTVVSSLSSPSLFLLAKDLAHMVIWASVNEADIGQIKAGQDVTFTVDAYGDRKFHGTVSKVRMDAQMTQNVVTYTVEIAADNKDRALVPYMTANVSFVVAKRDDALLVPVAALRWSPSNPELVAPDARAELEAREQRRASGGNDGRPTTRRSNAGASREGGERGTVWIVEGQFVRPLRVRTGITDNVNTEIVSDELKEGQQIVIGDAVAGAAAASGDDAKNPFAPQFPRGGRGGAGGGGGGGGRR